MSEKDLCWACKEEFLNHPEWELGLSDHCHHEPKEKEKCWCESPLIKYGYIYEINGELIVFHNCPHCGQPLKK